MLNDLLLLSGNDIPFIEGSVNIHQPSIKEIGYIGEETFHMGCYLLNLSQDLIEIEDKTNLEKMSDFDILMSIINDKSMSTKAQKIDIFLVLTLLFPEHEIKFSHNEILLIKRNSQGEILEQGQTNKENFETFIVKDLEGCKSFECYTNKRHIVTTPFDFENTDTFVLSIAIIIPTIMESEHSNHVLDIFIR